MRPTILKVAVIASLGLVPASAMACEFHGGGFYALSGANWQKFTPRVSYEDPALIGDGRSVAPLETSIAPRAKRPSFSSAADRASRAAKAKLAATAEEGEDTPKATDESQRDVAALNSTTRGTRSEPDAETIR